MKKRIISIALVVVMLVGMVSTMIMGVSAYTYKEQASFDAYYTKEEIYVDAEMDDAYLSSEQVSDAYVYFKGSVGSGFDAWNVVSDDGLHAFVKIYDKTIGSEYIEYAGNRKAGNTNTLSDSDKLQYCFSMEYVNGTKWFAYLELDYFANNVDGEQFANVNSDSEVPYYHARWKVNGGATATDTPNAPEGVQYATRILRDANGEYAWVAEIFVAWDVVGNVPAEQENTIPTTAIGLQVQNRDWNSDGMVRNGESYSRYDGFGNFYNSCDNYTPLNVITNKAYIVYTSTDPVVLDGEMDDVYLNSTKVDTFGGYRWGSNDEMKKGTLSNSYAYTVATTDGIYMFIHVDDKTMNNKTGSGDGDGVEVYMDWTPDDLAHDDLTSGNSGDDYRSATHSVTGAISADYNGNLSGNRGFQYVTKASGDVAVHKIENPEWDGEDIQTQYIGYNLEIFVPFTGEMKAAVATQGNYHFGLGFQLNNDTTYDGTNNRQSIHYDTGAGDSYYIGYEKLPNAAFKYEDNMVTYTTGAAVSNVQFDGANTNGEYDKAEAIHVNLNHDGAVVGSADDGDIYRVICDGQYVYILMESVDNTPMSGDEISLYFARMGGYHKTWDGWYRNFTRSSSSDSEYKIVDNGENGFAVEAKIALRDEEKAMFQNGTLVLSISVRYTDATSSGSTACADSRKQNYFYVCGDYTPLLRKIVLSNAPAENKLTGANVLLGASLTINYYATLDSASTNAVLKVTMNDKVTYLGAKKADEPGKYKFVFEGIAPQCMGDNIKAELIVDGEVVSTKDDYSILANVTSASVMNSETEQLIYDLLAYGAAAQKYTGYKMDSLVNKGYEDKTLAGKLTIENDDRGYTDPLEDARFTAAGVHHANINSIYVKFIADDITNTTITIDGKPAVVEACEITDPTTKDTVSGYIVYSEGIKVIDFDKVYTFAITTATGTQTLSYSINAYAYQKIVSDDAATANLAHALYAYGVSAENYIAGNN